jgi:PAS domain S-box-containing protein
VNLPKTIYGDNEKPSVAIHSADVQDQPASKRFERIMRLAANVSNSTGALLTLVEAESGLIKASYDYNFTESKRDNSFTSYTLDQDAPLIIPDTSLDPRFSHNSLVTGEPFVRFYAGFQLFSLDGSKVGTLGIFNTRPRHLSGKEQGILNDLARQAEDEIKSDQLAAALHERDRIAGLLLGQKKILEDIARGMELTDLMNELARFIENQEEGLLCSVLKLEKVQGKPGVLRVLAAPSLPEEYLRAIDKVEIGPNVGSCGTAVYLKKQVIVSDIENDPLWENFRDLALSHNLRACWSTPIRGTRGEVLGSFAVYYQTTRKPDAWELQLLDVASFLAGIAMERVQMNQLLNESEDRYKNIFETSLDAIFITGSDGLIYTANQAACNMLNYSEEELQRLGRSGVVDPADPNLLPLLEERDRLGYGRSLITFIRKDGTKIPCEVATATFMDKGDKKRNSVLIRDISEHLKTEQKLKAYARQQAAIAALGQEALINPNVQALMDQAVARVSQTLEVEQAGVVELLPGGQDMMLRAGIGFGPLIDGEARIKVNPNSQSGYTVLTKGPVIIEDLRQEKRFSLSPLISNLNLVSSASVLIWDPQEAYGVLNVFTGTRRRFTDEEVHFLQAVANVLAAAIQRQRAAASLLDSQEQLRQSQKIEAVGRLAGGIAHDFNNILTAIMAYSELALYKLDKPYQVQKDIEQIQMAADRAADLTRQLLAFSRRQILESRVLNLNEVVADLGKMLHRLIGENINLVTDLDDSLEFIKADPGQVQQVIMNLTVNGRDAMPAGGTLLIETGNVILDEKFFNTRGIESKPGPYVRLTVTDTGHGMDAETLSHIYEPFYTTKPQGKGTGLGLSTVYGIVAQSEGFIEVKSKPEQGTTFFVYFPVVDMEGQVLTGAIKGDPAESIKPCKKTHRILLVEDEDAVRASTLEILKLLGYEVLTASNGEEALKVSQECPDKIDLLISDIIMPVMNGPEMNERLKKLRPGIKTLFISGYTDKDIIEGGRLKEETNLLHKPFSISTLNKKLVEILGKPEI